MSGSDRNWSTRLTTRGGCLLLCTVLFVLQPTPSLAESPSPPVPAASVPYEEIFIREATRVGIPWQLLAGIVCYESNFNPRLEMGPPYHERGLGQFTEETWVWVTGSSWRSAFDPQQNIAAIADYMSILCRYLYRPEYTPVDTFNAALTAYNWGPGNVTRRGVERAPATTRRHVLRILYYAGYELPAVEQLKQTQRRN